jgi:hypothetical protein
LIFCASACSAESERSKSGATGDFGMSFLAPLFLFGALAVALPVIFHLIRRTSKERMPFSSLMFLQPTPPRVTRRNRLENILLLILRCLVLCLLTLGFGRPFFDKPMVPDPQTGAGRKIILLVDTSASMRRQNLWSLALAKANEVLKKTSPADQVAVFTFDQQTHSLVSFDQWSAMNAGERVALAARQLADLQPGWAATHLGSALLNAAEAFAEADKQGQNIGARRIVLITDLQEGARLEGLQGYDWPRGIEVDVETVKAARPTNAGLQWVVDADDSPKAGADAGPRVRVVNAPGSKREQFQIRWEAVSGAPPLDVYVPPGQSRIVPAPVLATDVTADRLALTGDDDDFDNTLYLVQPKPEQVNILFLGADSEKDPARLLYYLKRAFQQTRRQIVQVNSRPADAPLPADELAGVRLLIAVDVLNDPQFKATEKFVADGGTLLFVLTNVAAAGSMGRLMGADNLLASEAPASGYAMLGRIDFEHPLFAPFADPRYSDFTKIHFWKHRRIETDQLSGARIVAKFDNGDAALIEVPREKGRVLVLTSGWNPGDSQLALSSKFVPMLYSMLDQAGGPKAQISQYRVGEVVDLAWLKSSEPLTVRKPDGSEVKLGSGENLFSRTDLPGIYSVIPPQSSARFAVNLDAAESRTAPLPAEELMRLGVPLKAPEVEMAKGTEQRRRLHSAELENQQKLWRWLIVAALVVLLMETWLAGWLTRRPNTQVAA